MAMPLAFLGLGVGAGVLSLAPLSSSSPSRSKKSCGALRISSILPADPPELLPLLALESRPVGLSFPTPLPLGSRRTVSRNAACGSCMYRSTRSVSFPTTMLAAAPMGVTAADV
ncbi:hypothetical protein DFJ74DRAFT_673915 [Hyaloraphidium curvatum]|nr:hypothetical protein DFJ74DRAFT_673915 [Hyaloraphidium curvatum]